MSTLQTLPSDQSGLSTPLGVYMREISRTPVLSGDEEVALAMAIERGRVARQALGSVGLSPERCRELLTEVERGDAARKRLTEANLRLVVSIAKRYVGRGMPLPDLIQEGNIGLMRAVDKFDHKLGYRFSTYATWWIRQAIIRAIDDKAKVIRLPVHVLDTTYQVALVASRLQQDLGREPTLAEVAEATGMSVEKIKAVSQQSRAPVSLDRIASEGEGSDLAELLADPAAVEPDEAATQGALKDQIALFLGQLDSRHRRVIELRFGLADGRTHTLEEVGQELGITRERARQLERTALRRLQHSRRIGALYHFVA